MKKISTFLTFLSILSTLHAQDVVRGTVFADTNKNGVREQKEAGIPNVSVSNGVQVVKTDAKGKYELPLGKDNIIFVIKPTDYSIPVNANNHPQFYYIHKPEGSPASKYAGVAATGKLTKPVDFALIPAKEDANFSAFVFGDPQAYTLDELEFFKKGVIDQIGDKQIAKFGISLGDLVGDDLSLHPAYQTTIAKMGLPWFQVMGNHDMNYDATTDSLSDESFEATFGPNNYSFNYGNAHFIVLDDILYPHPTKGKGYLGGFRKEQLDFVENDLKLVPKDRLIVLAFHIPLLMEHDDVFRVADRQRLFDLLADFPHTLSLSAHTHFQTQNFYDQKDGWKQSKPHHEYNVGTTSGDWYSGIKNELGVPVSTMRDGTPKGYAVLNIKGNQYTFDYKVAGKDPQYQIAIYGPEIVAQKYSGRYPIYANFFIGRKGDNVQYRIDDGTWKAMDYAEEADPAYVYAVSSYDLAKELLDGRRPSDGISSTHLWKMKLPKLKAGNHKIEIQAVDMFGRTHTGVKEIKVEASK
ncbi:calcineurin-like phosphoesterase C-terminal domain-containing protein [Sphingobacterium spiritivorum]|uniref:calcineurin-like phosphoesterase C-terminal domain-containing protein n=1 Tax=Sphingobacterium spiritivorum TaxID=258 RepID=UPI003DA23712